MKNLAQLTLALLILFSFFSCSDSRPDYLLHIEINEITIPDAPALNTYVNAVHEGQWLIIGGRTDGLHDHRPDRSYPIDKSNNKVFVIDPANREVWSASLESLSQNLFEQLQSTGMSFYQEGNVLTLLGGYGWSDSKEDYITFPYLVQVDVAGLMRAIRNGQKIDQFFYQVMNQDMAVSGGYLGKIGEEFYLVFGQRFDGRYSTQPNKGHRQEYTNEIRKFRMEKESGTTVISDLKKVRDTVHFHRRDYNLLPQIFPNGKFGYTAFSGVFQYERNFPWLYPVNIFEDNYEVVESFEQQFSNYHSACVPVFRKSVNQMDNLFFGGMARFVPDAETGEVINDPLVPSVNTISQVSRFSDGSLKEGVHNIKMPGLLGASANFIPAQNIPFLNSKIVDYDNLPRGKTLIGYIYGGLESSHPNIFLRPVGTSKSTNRIFEVFIIKP
jgi:hypothetical protein